MVTWTAREFRRSEAQALGNFAVGTLITGTRSDRRRHKTVSAPAAPLSGFGNAVIDFVFLRKVQPENGVKAVQQSHDFGEGLRIGTLRP
jgi:hypothetical protein